MQQAPARSGHNIGFTGTDFLLQGRRDKGKGVVGPAYSALGLQRPHSHGPCRSSPHAAREVSWTQPPCGLTPRDKWYRGQWEKQLQVQSLELLLRGAKRVHHSRMRVPTKVKRGLRAAHVKHACIYMLKRSKIW